MFVILGVARVWNWDLVILGFLDGILLSYGSLFLEGFVDSWTRILFFLIQIVP